MRKLIWSSYFEIRGRHLKALKIDKKWFSTKNLGQVSEDQAAELKTVHFSISSQLECAGSVTLLEVTRTVLLSSCVSDLPHSPLLIPHSGKCHCRRLQYLFVVVVTVFYCFAFRDFAFLCASALLIFLKNNNCGPQSYGDRLKINICQMHSIWMSTFPWSLSFQVLSHTGITFKLVFT